jgi:hypothetical protein
MSRLFNRKHFLLFYYSGEKLIQLFLKIIFSSG